ncbi:hypothetical protein JNUCC0626_34060 [Lentzea sp. JNUCC 0626]|uniref:hypothetical protein n=1 Tax=Lentzea sp. JNUCC 0626 TaxID=3367513 RepID=UPI003749D0DE
MGRARVVAAAVVLVSAALAVFGGWSLSRGGAGIVGIGLSAGLVFLLVLLPKGMGLEVVDERHLSGRTLSGRRTVDLGRLTSVRRVRVPAGSVDFHWVELVDADGVRMFVNDESAPREVKQALAEHTAGLPHMSRWKAFLFTLLLLAPLGLALLVFLIVH